MAGTDRFKMLPYHGTALQTVNAFTMVVTEIQNGCHLVTQSLWIRPAPKISHDSIVHHPTWYREKG